MAGTQNGSSVMWFFKDKGFDDKSIHDMFRKCKRLEGLQRDRASQNWAYLKSIGIMERKLPYLISKCPKVLTLGLDEKLIPVINCLATLGTKPHEVASAITKFPHILSYSVEEKLCPLLAFLQAQGVPEKQLGKIILLNPRLISYSIESKLSEIVDFLSGLGLTKDGMIGKVLVKHPFIMGYSVDKRLRPTTEFLKAIGLTQQDLRTVVLNFPEVVCRDADKILKPNFAYLRTCGFSDRQIVTLVTGHPPILVKSIRNSLEPRIKFLIQVMHRGMDEVVDYPNFFQHGLKKNLEWRFKLLKENNISCSLSEMLDCSQKKFLTKFNLEEEEEEESKGRKTIGTKPKPPEETQEKLAHIYHSHPTFETEFKRCINETDTVDEFESSWQSLLQRYYVMDDEWLQSMYDARQQWVPVFMRNTFFGVLSSSEESGGLNSFFDGYVDASTTLHMLIKQYEKAVANWHEKELKADYDTVNTMPVLKTPSPMEKQAASLYTRRVFMKFQEELVETLANPATKIEDSGTTATYRVAKFGEDHKAHTEAIKYVEEGAKSIHIYNVAIDALQEAAKKVAAAKILDSGVIQGGNLTNGETQELHAAGENRTVMCQSADEKKRKIHELSAELESTNQRCEVYRANLLAVLRDMEEQKLKLSVKVQNARLSLKE
ncbi:hypothetical protein Tsubulata_014625 [Turnera subulata]|uniref:Protein FAR1-RELATED SEQUENCE n=1 Tax=Turnera subulata TaxID=218843 RepID=A0A9Q0JN12_9ROSI|nr:hypothetical protein Tsubulata_014625 [Turnera subulata]